MSETPYAEFLQLAHGPEGVRHVRTPEGAAFFNLPIGSPISEALYQQIKADHLSKGHTWPKGMTSKNPKKVETGGFGSNNIAGGDAAEDAAAKAAHNIPAPASPPTPGAHVASPPHAGAPAAPGAPEVPHIPVPPQKPSPVKASSLEGPNKFSVGTVKYSAPAGSRLYVPTSNSGIVFVATPDGNVHSFNAKGEIQVHDPIVQQALVAKFTPNFAGDTNFTVGQFDPTPGPNDLPGLPVGTTLNDHSGVPQFTKTGPDQWTHNGLGITLASSDVQPFLDSGELSVGTGEPGKNEQGHVDFASMDQPTFISTLGGYKTGQVLYYNGQEIKKTGPDKWSNGHTDSASSKDLWFLKNSLSEDKKASTEPAHVAPVDTPTQVTADAAAPAAPNPPAATEAAPAAAPAVPASDQPAAPNTPSAPTESAPVTHVAAEKKSLDAQAMDALKEKLKQNPLKADEPKAAEPAKPETPKAEPTVHTAGQDLKPGDKLTHVDQLSHLNGGSSVKNDASQGIWTKKPSGMFQKKSTWQHSITKATADSYEFKSAIDSGHISLHEHGPAEDKTSSEAPKASEQAVKPAEASLKHGDPIKLNQLKDIPVGKAFTVTSTPPSGSGTQPSSSEYVRKSENKWQMVKKTVHQNPPVWTTAHMAQFLDGDKNKSFTYNDHPSADATEEVKKAEPKAPEAPKAETPKTFADLKHGDVIAPEHIDQMKAGDQIKTSGDGKAIKTKQADGTFLHHPMGSPQNAKKSSMQGEELKKFAHGGLIKHEPATKETPQVAPPVEAPKAAEPVAAEPKVAEPKPVETKAPSADLPSQTEQAQPSDFSLAVGDTVPSVEHLNHMAPATVLDFAKKDGSTGQYTKLPNGNWLNPGGVQYDANSFGNGIKAGKFKVHSYPSETGVTPSDQNAHTLIPGGKVYSHDDLAAALNALQNHPSHQIAYGLKSLDEKNLLHESHGNQNELKIGAASEFPNLKGKPGAIALLKKKLGIQDNPVQTHASTSTEEKVSISAGDQKHSFTKAEIDQAKKILEGYQGKLWANELSKQGSPLGDMKWNDVIGFHKDKNEGKKEAIKLLDEKSKQFLAVEKPQAAEQPTPPAPTAATPAPEKPVNTSFDSLKPGDTMTWNQFKTSPNGTVIHWENTASDSTPYDATFENGMWTADSGMKIPTDAWKAALDAGFVSLKSKPEAVNSAPHDDSAPFKTNITYKELQQAKPGDSMAYVFKTGKTAVYFKQPNGKWIRTDDSTQTPRLDNYFQGFFDQAHPGTSATLIPAPKQDLPDYAKTPEAVVAKEDSTNLEADTGHNASGILPGKWTSTSGAYMIVNADGTGKFYSKDGGASDLSAAKVKILHDQSMKQYEGIPETTPVPQVEKAVATPVVATPAAPKTAASKTAVKKKVLPPVALPNGTYYLGDPSNWKTMSYTVADGQVTIKTNSGVNAGKVETVPVAKLKTNFYAGKILDSNGNSVLPEGHTGSVTMWSSPMTTAALIEAKKYLETKNENGFFHSQTQADLKKLGFYVSPWVLQERIKTETPNWGETLGSTYSLSHNADSPWQAVGSKAVLDQINQFLAHVDTTIPESNAKGNFDWTANGEAIMPNDVIQPLQQAINFASTQNLTAATNAIKKAYGPKVLGGVAMNKYSKKQWLVAFSKGDFQAMYKVEVDAAAQKGVGHPSGYMHPGYEGNAETHQISWAAAVPGEIKAGGDVPGDWSSVSPAKWSKDELQNYLISAQMQNPEHLNLAEQRQWVTHHQGGDKLKTDALSIRALERKNAGDAPLSETPVWTDNIVPAKLYDHLFDENPFPTSNKWTPQPYEVSQAWAKDNWNNAEFKQILHDSSGEKPNLGDYPLHSVESAVGKYFDGKHAEYQAELLKPVYSHVKVLAGGSHDVHLYQDQFGKKYVFKPSDDAHLFRAESEAAAGQLSNFWGFNTPKTDIKTLEVPGKGEQTGLFQNFQESISDFNGPDGKGIDLATLTNKQLGQLASEHVLDWALDNDDAHEQNMLITPSGDLVGIDKGRGFRAYGNWNGLTGDSGAHTNMLPGSQLAYTPLYDGIRKGTITKEQADAAYLAALKAAERIKKSDDAAVAALVHSGVDNRPNWGVPGYMNHFDHSQAPKSADELVKAVLDRKSKIDAQIKEMWAKIYKQAGLGDLPVPPPYVLGEQHLSGWSEGHTFQKVAETKVWGSAPIHASSEFQDGHSLLWTEKAADGSDLHYGSFKVAPLTQEKLVQFLDPKSGTVASLTPQTVANFPNLSEWKSAFSHAGKDVSKNAIDKNFDPEIQKKFSDTKAIVQADAAHWQPDLQPGADGFIEFPSGNKVPANGLDQYKVALSHNLDMAEKVDAAKGYGTTTNKNEFNVLPVYAYAAEPKVYTNSDVALGSYKQLSTNSYIHSLPGGQLQVVQSLPSDVQAGESGWSLQPGSDVVTQDQVLYHKASAGDGIGTLAPGGIKTQSDGWGSAGHPGQEYEITLPTGEKIWFRNSNKTSTSKSQSGMLRFKLSGSDQASSLARIESHLQTMGLNTQGADEPAAENVYWRNMFSRLIGSNVTGAPTKVQTARQTLIQMRSDLAKKLNVSSVSDQSIVEAIGLTMQPSEERAFWVNLANETFGPDKVSAWIAAGKHLPQYSHMDLSNPESTTGKPYWDRIDVSHEDLIAKNTMLAIGNSGKDDSLLRYITSGGMLSTEERLRVLGYWKDGASSSSDQGTGGATGVFTRIAVPGTSVEKNGAIYGAHVAYWNPKVLAQTGTYSYSSDTYGNVSELASENKFNPLKSLSQNTGNGNETLIQHQLSILDHLEIMVFNDPSKRNEAIQRMKELGHETLRGVPIEDRMIMRENLDQAMKVVKAAWTQQ